MKFYSKAFSLVLAMIFVLSLFAACKPADGGNEGNKTLITINADYVIVRPELCSSDVIKAASSLRTVVCATLGADVALKEDFLYGDETPAQYEILIGQTNREESANALADLKYQDYSVTVSGSKLVINAYTDEKLLEAVEYVKGLIADGKLDIAQNDLKTVRAEYQFDQLKFGDTDLSGYTIVIPKKANNVIKSFAAKLQGAILEKSGVYLPLVNDDKEEAEKEIEELREQQLTTDQYLKHIGEVRARLNMAIKDASSGVITNEFVAQYIDKIFVTLTDNDTANLKIKIFTGKNTEKWLKKLNIRAKGRMGVTSKKMIESYENSLQNGSAR